MTVVSNLNIDVFYFIHTMECCCRAETKEGCVNKRPVLGSQVNAEDLDGPSHSHVRYSIVDGNQGSPFTIDSVRGELKVAHQLDRERVREATVALPTAGAVPVFLFNTLLSVCQTSGYTLTVLASDSGVPPLSSSSTINVDISDVNDNPPLFSQANYSLIIQVNAGSV